MKTTQRERAETLRRLHSGPGILILPNAWDVATARLVEGHFDVHVRPALVDHQHPLAKVDGAFNAVMLQGDAIREITLEGPGAGGLETASAVIADMASVIGTMGTGFLQNDAAWRTLPRRNPHLRIRSA